MILTMAMEETMEQAEEILEMEEDTAAEAEETEEEEEMVRTGESRRLGAMVQEEAEEEEEAEAADHLRARLRTLLPIPFLMGTQDTMTGRSIVRSTLVLSLHGTAREKQSSNT